MINKELKLKYIKSLKSGGKVPKYLTAWGKLDKQDELDDWTRHWGDRLKRESSSKIVGGWKLGAHKEEFQTGLRVPRAQFSEAGVGNTDAARRHGIWRSTEEPIESEWADYVNNIVRYNRFFGPEQGNGGIQTVLSRRPRYTWENPFDMKGRRFGETIYYDNGKLYENIHALETDLGNDSRFQGRDLINGRNPLLMRTIIAPRDSYFYGLGLKKGGKLLKKKSNKN